MKYLCWSHISDKVKPKLSSVLLLPGLPYPAHISIAAPNVPLLEPHQCLCFPGVWYGAPYLASTWPLPWSLLWIIELSLVSPSCEPLYLGQYHTFLYLIVHLTLIVRLVASTRLEGARGQRYGCNLLQCGAQHGAYVFNKYRLIKKFTSFVSCWQKSILRCLLICTLRLYTRERTLKYVFF